MYITLLCGEFLPKAEECFRKELQHALYSILKLAGDKASWPSPLKSEGDTLESVGQGMRLRVRCHASHSDLLELIPAGQEESEQIVIAFVGACTEGGSGQWLLKDCLADSKLVARKLSENLLKKYGNRTTQIVDAVGDCGKEEERLAHVNVVLLSSEKICTSWSNFPQQLQEHLKTHVLADVTMRSLEQSPNVDDAAYTMSFTMTYQIMEQMRPLPVFDRLPSSNMNGSVHFSRPTLYVFSEGDGSAAFFGVPGYNLLIDGGFSITPTFWNFVRCCYGLNCLLLTNWSANNLLGPHSFLERIASSADEHAVKDGEQASGIEDPLSRMHQFGLLHPPGPSHNAHNKLSPEGGEVEVNLDVNIVQWANQLLSSFVKPHFHLASLELVGGKSLSTAPRCIPLYQNWTIGTLELFVLNPLEEEAELKKFLAEWSREKEKFSTSPVNPSKQVISLLQCMSLCVLLVWKPTDAAANITRLLFPGNCPQSRVLLAMNAAQAHLSYLKYATGKPSAASAGKLAVPTARKLSPASSKRGSIGSLGSKSGSGASSKPVASSTDKKPVASRASAAPSKKPAPPSNGGRKEATAVPGKALGKKEAPPKPLDSTVKPLAEPPVEDCVQLSDVQLTATGSEEPVLASIEPAPVESEHQDTAPQQQLTREQMREMGIFDDAEDESVEVVSSQEDLSKDAKSVNHTDAPANYQNGVEHKSGDQSPSHMELKHQTEFDPTAEWGQPMNLPPADDAPSSDKGSTTKSTTSSGGKSGSSKPSLAPGGTKSAASAKASTKTASSSSPASSSTTARRPITAPSSGGATGGSASSRTAPSSASAGGAGGTGTFKRPGAPSSGSGKSEDKGSATSRAGTTTKPGTTKTTASAGSTAGAAAGAKSARTAPSTTKVSMAKGHTAPESHVHPPGTSIASGHGGLNKSAPYDKLLISYVDCAYIPAAGDPHLVDVEFFKRVRSRYYILSCLEPAEETLDALLIAKESWADADAQSKVSLIPTYDSPALLRWVQRNFDRLQKAQLEIEPSASKCLIELEDVQTRQKDSANVATAYRIIL